MATKRVICAWCRNKFPEHSGVLPLRTVLEYSSQGLWCTCPDTAMVHQMCSSECFSKFIEAFKGEAETMKDEADTIDTDEARSDDEDPNTSDEDFVVTDSDDDDGSSDEGCGANHMNCHICHTQQTSCKLCFYCCSDCWPSAMDTIDELSSATRTLGKPSIETQVFPAVEPKPTPEPPQAPGSQK